MKITTAPVEWNLTTKKEWSHQARDAVRRVVWKQVDKERRREEMNLGISNGIDRGKTMMLYNKVDPRKKGILRKILLGAVWTRSRLAKMRDPICTEECPCGAPKETLRHLWLECPLWENERLAYADLLPRLEAVPRATQELGLFVQDDMILLAPDAERLHRMMICIFEKRFGSLIDALGPS